MNAVKMENDQNGPPKEIPFIVRWREAVLSEQGPESSSTRLVLMALSIHMNKDDGGSCYPSIKKLKERTGFGSNRTVITGINDAVRQGWLKKWSGRIRKNRVAGGQCWPRNSYQATLPKNFKENSEQSPEILYVSNQAGAPTAPAFQESGEAGALDVKGGARRTLPCPEAGALDDKKVVHRVNTSSSYSSSKKENSSGTEPPDGKGYKSPFPPAQFRKRKQHRLQGPYSQDELEAQKKELFEKFGPQPEQPVQDGPW